MTVAVSLGSFESTLSDVKVTPFYSDSISELVILVKLFSSYWKRVTKNCWVFPFRIIEIELAELSLCSQVSHFVHAVCDRGVRVPNDPPSAVSREIRNHSLPSPQGHLSEEEELLG